MLDPEQDVAMMTMMRQEFLQQRWSVVLGVTSGA